MIHSLEQVRPAQARWQLHSVILQEEERRIVDALEESSRSGSRLPRQAFERLKASRAQCDEAFQDLLVAIERSAAR